ncbi:hypothetical protein HC256_008235 [Beauveria bassiana]|nr:hypothetical protein HC256_008235 [Beauveria bassiana]
MAERAPKLISGQEIGLGHESLDQKSGLSPAAKELLSLPATLTYTELLEQIKKNDKILFRDREDLMTEARISLDHCRQRLAVVSLPDGAQKLPLIGLDNLRMTPAE